MNTKTSTTVALLAVVAAPLVSQASEPTSNTPFDACIKAFATTYLPSHSVRDTRVDQSYTSATAQYWKPRQYTIELRARGVESGAMLAKARCVVDNGGVVLVVEPPLAEAAAER